MAIFGAPVNEASFSFRTPESFLDPNQGLGGLQRSGLATNRRFDSIEQAGRRGTEMVFATSVFSGFEWGGLICRQSEKYVWSRIVTDGDAGRVTLWDNPNLTQAQRDNLPQCAPYANSMPVGAFHAHPPPPAGQPYPSGFPPGSPLPNDLNTASLRPEVVFFVGTPVGNGGKGMLQFKYQAVLIPDGQGGSVHSARYNTFKWVGDHWVPFTDFNQ